MNDPDDSSSPFFPTRGYPSMDAALEVARRKHPGRTMIGARELGAAYGRETRLQTMDVEVSDGEYVVVHPATRHAWKNEENVIARLRFRMPVKRVGLPGELAVFGAGWEDLTAAAFDVQCAAVLRARCVVGVLSSWTNCAALFGKRQIVVTFTPDIQFVNSRCTALLRPSLQELQQAIEAEGL